jgi:hypothetical protein
VADRTRRTSTAARWAAAALSVVAAASTSGCSIFGGDDEGDAVSVFELEPGMCFPTLDEARAEVQELAPVDCGTEHTQEFMGTVTYPTEETGDAFPGQDVLDAFAQGACAEQFESYVGVSYLDSELFLTYLLPSPRSWDQDDRSISCFVTSAGAPLEGSVKGSKR